MKNGIVAVDKVTRFTAAVTPFAVQVTPYTMQLMYSMAIWIVYAI